MLDFSSTLYQDHPWSSLTSAMQQLGAARWLVVSDSNLHKILDWSVCPEAPLIVPAGEASKCLAQAEVLYAQLAQRNVTRDTWLVAVGGGVVGDLAGFVAATYLRGLPLVQVPTSLVAQVDSSLGGKVGVDLPAGKNLVGAFYPPRMIFLDSQLLATLPQEEWNSGMAEVLKHALIDSEEHWESLESLPAALNAQQRRALVERSRQVKRTIIEQDPLEKGIRAFLNLGHTLAHAIESVQNYRGWNHGQAVGFGLRAALRLSHLKLGLPQIWEKRLLAQLERYQLPYQAPKLDFSSLVPYLKRDKKNQHGKLRFVLLRQPGQAELCDQVKLEELEKIWEELQ